MPCDKSERTSSDKQNSLALTHVTNPTQLPTGQLPTGQPPTALGITQPDITKTEIPKIPKVEDIAKPTDNRLDNTQGTVEDVTNIGSTGQSVKKVDEIAQTVDNVQKTQQDAGRIG